MIDLNFMPIGGLPDLMFQKFIYIDQKRSKGRKFLNVPSSNAYDGQHSNPTYQPAVWV